ncbi:MAG: hypothetical protein B0D92_07055, partial [Spirochaeta sp. LUC14_002_19_P3]
AGDAQEELSWTAPTNTGTSADGTTPPISKYTVYWGTDSTAADLKTNGTAVTVNTGTPINTSVTIDSLTNGTIYYFTVTAWNAHGESSPVDPPESATPVPAGTVTGVSITGADTVIYGDTSQFTATVTPTDAFNKDITWSVTGGTGTATIDQTGELTATKAGTVTVKATSDADSTIFAEKTVTISPRDVSVDPTRVHIYALNATISAASDSTYTMTLGTQKLGSLPFVAGTDYDLSLKETHAPFTITNAGTITIPANTFTAGTTHVYTVVLTPKGNYTASAAMTDQFALTVN